jgi:dGTPase
MASAKAPQNPENKPAISHPADRLLGTVVPPPAALARYATLVSGSRGRFYPEKESATRTCYSRDRDRIIHSSAFRRLKHKTQVFVEHEGDYYRTRLTHSLEVAQLARSLARSLKADEDLAETVALAHDLGHTPFGHSGEEALDAVTADIGGFDHNAHALRLVTRLEHRYADFDGLNLTWETLEGLVKHNGPLTGPLCPSHAGRADLRGLPGPIRSFDARWPLDLSRWPGIEAQIAALADDIAYVNHDLDFIGEMIRTLMSALLDDLRAETGARLLAAGPASAEEVRAAPHALVALSPAMLEELRALKLFLSVHMYQHPRVMASMTRAKAVITDLFEAFSADPGLLPPDWAKACDSGATGGVVRDYIAGMTDTYALAEYTRVFRTQITL